MSTDSNEPSAPAAATEEPESSDAPEPRQPRWAWWVIGIAVPLLGILVSVLVSQSSSSSPSSATPPVDQSSPEGSAPKGRTPSASQTARESHGAASTKPVPVRFGPGEVKIVFDDDQDLIESFNPDFDSVPPFILEGKTAGSDLSFSRAPYHEGIIFQTYLSSKDVAPLQPGGTDPSEAECRTHLAEHATSGSGTLDRGEGFCVRTKEGRTAYIRVIDSPSGLGTLRLAVTVWELPS